MRVKLSCPARTATTVNHSFQNHEPDGDHDFAPSFHRQAARNGLEMTRLIAPRNNCRAFSTAVAEPRQLRRGVTGVWVRGLVGILRRQRSSECSPSRALQEASCTAELPLEQRTAQAKLTNSDLNSRRLRGQQSQLRKKKPKSSDNWVAKPFTRNDNPKP